MALFIVAQKGLSLLPTDGKKRAPTTASRNDPPSKRRNMGRFPPPRVCPGVLAARGHKLPSDEEFRAYYYGDAQSPAEPTGCHQGAWVACASLGPLASELIEKAAAYMKFPDIRKAPIRCAKMQCLNYDVRLEACEPDASSFARASNGAPAKLLAAALTYRANRKRCSKPHSTGLGKPLHRKTRKAA